ncbi:MAG: acetyl-CoA hydrolase/transferase family protein [Candidatus Marinimicrobia bacterium]|nr:acetyl-CoA hydrolase/transferase family protein [Candidatus Neomarinimicrobiota bacterium]
MSGAKSKWVSAEEATSVIKSGDKVFVGSGAAVPRELVQAMTARHGELRDVQVHHILTLGATEETAPYTAPGMEPSFTHHAWFIGPNTRAAVNEGRAYFIPVFLSEVPNAITRVAPEVALIQVSPPDKRGYCSLGVSVDVVRAAYKASKTVIAEVNPQQPQTQGYSYVHIDELDYLVEVDYPLYTYAAKEPTDEQRKVGENICTLIEDGATLQVGIGSIPDAALSCLKGHRDLGVHSEMISDGIMRLVECGAVTNERKHINPGKVIASFMLGTRDLYSWANRNPVLEMRPTEYTNDPYNVSRNDKVVAINSALSIDLKGQVCSDSLGRKFYSGIGGQVDFIRGAARSPGGKPIIAMPSTATVSDRTISRIVPVLDAGAGVVTSEGDVHYLVTEYGIASLHGHAVGERAEQLISIAHPDFREDLYAYARESGFIVKKLF